MKIRGKRFAMQKITSIIIDDEPAAIENLEYLLADMDSIKVLKTFTSPAKALDWLLENQAHLIFLDVEMPQMTGFEFLEQLQQYPDKPCIIFTTGYEKYAIDAIKATAFDYLLKPVSRGELTTSILKLKAYFIKEGRYAEVLKFKTRRGFVVINVKEIFYVEADGNYSNIHKLNGNHELVTTQIGKLTEILPNRDFKRISRKSIINCKYVTKVDTVSSTCRIEFNNLSAICKISKDKIDEILIGLI